MSDIDQMSLFDMYGDDDNGSFLMSSDTDFVMSEEEYRESKKKKEEMPKESSAAKTTVEPVTESLETKASDTPKVPKEKPMVSTNKGIPLTVKKPFASFNEGDTLGLISYINDSSGIVRTILATESGAIISMTYTDVDEFKEAFGE